ncbi:MAG: response regulator [Nitrososphaerales archaeon]
MNERKNSIIIVDDDESIRKTLAAILEQEGYDVETAGDGAKAILKSNEKLFDIALVDMRLPDMLGTELLGRIKERVPKTAKIMVTGYPTMQNAIQAVNEGADGYIVKPVEADVLLETIRKHLKRREEAAKYSEGKVVDFLETRKKELALKAAADRAAEKS